MMNRLWIAALVALLPGIAEAANCNSNPFTLTNGQTADATQVMANFNNLLNCSNNNLAHNGANSDITSLSGLTTPLSVPQGGTGAATFTATNGLLVANGTNIFTSIAPSTTGNLLTSNGTSWIATGASLTGIVDAANGGLLFVPSGTVVTASLTPSNLLTKTVPLSTDRLLIADVAAAQAAKTSTIAQVHAGMTGTTAQVVKFETGAVATGSTVMPFDDTIPQNSEGDQYMSLAITPTNVNSTLIIQIVVNYSANGNSQTGLALFQDANTNAIAASMVQPQASSNAGSTAVLTHTMAAGTTISTTFNVRVGAASGATITFNGVNAGRIFGGAMASSIVITEVLP